MWGNVVRLRLPLGQITGSSSVPKRTLTLVRQSESPADGNLDSYVEGINPSRTTRSSWSCRKCSWRTVLKAFLCQCLILVSTGEAFGFFLR